MENFDDIVDISEELIAAWLDGNLSPEEDSEFMAMLSSNSQLAEVMDAYDEIESDYEHLIEDGYEIPEELNLDFQLPSIDFIDDDELLASNQYSHVDYSGEEESLTSQEEENEGTCDSNDFNDNSDPIHDEEIDFF